MTLLIRPAVAADEPGIAAVAESALAVLRRIYRPTPAAIARKHEQRKLPRLVAVAGTEIVGTVEYALAEDRLHLMSLFVLASHRRQGVARALVDELAKLAGTRPLSLNTVRETGNVAVFERLGFSTVREEVTHDLVGESVLHDVYMTR
ncbi:MAG TPA: GNAT family N-acetyltransferase [Kofleriaceae bacterium]|nr:GNAT family N-acetyltransferase [Kofleriaceae bacterium]